MADISQTIFSDALSWMDFFVFWLKFHWNLFLRVHLKTNQHWFRWWLGAEQVTSHFLNQCWRDSLTHICGTRGRWGINNLTLQWRHNDYDGVLNYQPHGCLPSCLFRCRSKKTSKLHVTGLCVGNSPGPVNSPHKGPVTRKMFPFDDVIMDVCDVSMWTNCLNANT